MLEIGGPLLAGLLYTFASFYIRRALRGGINMALQFSVTNLASAVVVGGPALVLSGGSLVLHSFWPFLNAGFFIIGQILVILALRTGDSSIQTPIMGMKVLFVPAIVALAFAEPVPPDIWIAAVLATAAVFLIGFRRNEAQSFDIAPILATLGSTLFFAASDSVIAEMSGELGNAAFLASLLILVAAFSVPVGIGGLLVQLLQARLVRSVGEAQGAAGPAGAADPADPADPAGAAAVPGRPLPGRPVPGGAEARALLWGSLFMAVQFALFVSVLSLFSEAPQANILYATRGLWSIGLLFLLNRLGQGHHMEHARTGTIVQRFVGAALLFVAVIVTV
ncbi:MAG: hypothetical protein ACLFO1_03955 [Spirochaetaceae bacterium]